jgi:hypothetical protein
MWQRRIGSVLLVCILGACGDDGGTTAPSTTSGQGTRTPMPMPAGSRSTSPWRGSAG